MDRFKDMQLLAAVVEHGSFARAADAVELTPAMVGRRIAALENRLGFVLFNRTTRRMELTPGGRSYYQGCEAILQNVTELEESVTSAHQSNPKGLIRISAPDGLGSPFLIGMIQQFRLQYPQIRFDIDLSSEPKDLILDAIDLSLRLAFELADSSVVASPLGETGFALYAAPDYLQQRGVPDNLQDLQRHDCLHMGSSRYGDYWNLLADGQRISYRQEWAVTVPNTQCLLNAAISGMGIAMIPQIFARKAFSSGDLQEITGIAEFPRVSIYAMYPTRRHLPYRVNLFLDFLKVRAPELLQAEDQITA